MPRGRPRQFDPTLALEQALTVFRRDGFERASVQELADRMAICKPSLYAAYGNKEALFLEAVRLYARRGADARQRLLDGEPDGKRAVEALLRHTIAHVTSGEVPGCLLVGELASAPATLAAPVRAALAAAHADGAAALRQRLVRAQSEGHLSASADLDTLTGFFGAIMTGFAVQARHGATAAQLEATVAPAMRAWEAP